jgi:hypothetical protein
MSICSIRSLAIQATFGLTKRYKRCLLGALLLIEMWLPLPAMSEEKIAAGEGSPRITASATVGNDALSRNGNFLTVETASNLQISFEHTLTAETTVQATAKARAVYGCIDNDGVISNTVTMIEEVLATGQFRPVDNVLTGTLQLQPPAATDCSCPMPLTLLSAKFSNVTLQSSAGAFTELEGDFSSATGSCVCIPGRCCCGPIGKPCKWCPGSKPCAFNVAEPAAVAAADLLPVSPPGSALFCKAVSGKLSAVIRVRNVGSGFAPASITRVNFSSLGSVDLPTPGILPDGFVDLGPVSLPEGCFNPDCNFIITVDAIDSVDEGVFGETHNIATGSCIG